MGCLHLESVTPRPDRPAPFDDDVSFSESLVEAMLDRYTEPGDVVLDPFAGFGTTIAVAERMGRVGYGIELLPERAAFIRDRIDHPERVITADVATIGSLRLPPFRLSLSSPPYMTRTQHPQNPLTGYTTLDGDYARYLDELRAIYVTIAHLGGEGSHVAINVANLRTAAGPTPLAWDLGRALVLDLDLVDELVVCWDRPDPMVSQDHCLVFAARN